MNNKILKASTQDPLEKDIIHTRGDTFLWDIIGYNEDFTPYDFTGYTFAMKLRRAPSGTVVVDIDNTSFTISNENGTKDKVTIEEDKASFTNIDLGTYLYDVQFTDASGRTFTFIKGKFEMRYDIA